jgi:hypothetical protein
VPNARQRGKLASLLLDQMDGDGWEFGPELLRALSVSRDNSPAKNRAAVMKHRIENLAPPRRRQGADSTGQGEADGERCPWHPVRFLDDCPCQTAQRAEREQDGDESPPEEPDDGTGDQVAAVRARLGLDRPAAERRRAQRERRAARTPRGRADAEQKNDAEFEARRAEALRDLEGLEAKTV